jgi:Leucine-rich repeat (LRR) protein
VEVAISEGRLRLKEFSEAAAACRSIDLAISHFFNEVVDLSDLDAVAGCLRSLSCGPIGDWPEGRVRGTSALRRMSQLTALHLDREDLRSEEPWGVLAKLTSLQQLELLVIAHGDPSPLSALTELSFLLLRSYWGAGDGAAPFSLSSLQPLSTLQQLEGLHVGSCACGVTSLQGLAGLSNLTMLEVESSGELVSLEGISPGVVEVSIGAAPELVSLAGLEECTSMEKLTLVMSGVSSLQPLRCLSSLKHLRVYGCALTSLEGLNSTSLQSLRIERCLTVAHLSGVGHLSTLKSLEVIGCSYVTSLQPLSQLGEGLQKLRVIECKKVQEEVLELPRVQPTADVIVQESNVREVVVAGGVRLTCKR